MLNVFAENYFLREKNTESGEKIFEVRYPSLIHYPFPLVTVPRSKEGLKLINGWFVGLVKYISIIF